MADVTSIIDIRKFKTEIVNYVSSKINTLDPKSRITETTTTFSGDASTRRFLLSTKLKYISSVSVDSTAKSYGTDWLPITDPDDDYYGYIEFTVASTPGSGTDNISVTYGYGDKGWVYPDFLRKDLAISQYPRVGIGFMETTTPFAVSNSQHNNITQLRVSVLILAENTRLIDKIDYTLKDSLAADAKTFYNFQYLRPEGSRNLVLSEDASNMVIGRNRDYIIPFRVEVKSYT